MMQKKVFVFGITIAAMLAILVAAVPAGAAPDVTTTTQIVKGKVDWVLSAATCPEIQYDLTGTGKRFQVITTVTNANGNQKIYSNDFVTGTATDTNGGVYDFVYSNQDRRQIPPGGSPVQIRMIDSFLLTGTGTADLNSAFDWSWTFAPPDSYWPPVDNWQQKITIGDSLHCDPI
jgi:hypothetical protein